VRGKIGRGRVEGKKKLTTNVRVCGVGGGRVVVISIQGVSPSTLDDLCFFDDDAVSRDLFFF